MRTNAGQARTTLRKRTEADGAVRERLLESALGLFTRKGYASTTVREIVAAAGVTQPVLYYYFRNKEGIYLELMERGFRKFDALLEAAAAGTGSATRQLSDLSDRVYALFREKIGLARLMYSIYYGPPQGAPFFDFDAYHFKFQDAVRRLVEEGIRRREFRRGNPETMTWAVIGAVNTAMELELCHPEISPGREGLFGVLEILFRGMAPGTRGRKGERR
ncbi:MAG: TetR/AcrR family transcriptional regulator [Deltaproteobacteria bacterium]